MQRDRMPSDDGRHTGKRLVPRALRWLVHGRRRRRHHPPVARRRYDFYPSCGPPRCERLTGCNGRGVHEGRVLLPGPVRVGSVPDRARGRARARAPRALARPRSRRRRRVQARDPGGAHLHVRATPRRSLPCRSCAHARMPIRVAEHVNEVLVSACGASDSDPALTRLFPAVVQGMCTLRTCSDDPL
jgi:hypothetical protein